MYDYKIFIQYFVYVITHVCETNEDGKYLRCSYNYNENICRNAF